MLFLAFHIKLYANPTGTKIGWNIAEFKRKFLNTESSFFFVQLVTHQNDCLLSYAIVYFSMTIMSIAI